MSVLENLTFAPVATKALETKEEQRRAKLINRLKEQRVLAEADTAGKEHGITKRHWKIGAEGNKELVQVQKRVKRWWMATDGGKVSLVVRWGAKKLEFQPGKAAIVVGSSGDLPSVIDSLIAATASGELDAHIAAVADGKMPARKAKR